jgi:hypothetical protein
MNWRNGAAAPLPAGRFAAVGESAKKGLKQDSPKNKTGHPSRPVDFLRSSRSERAQGIISVIIFTVAALRAIDVGTRPPVNSIQVR